VHSIRALVLRLASQGIMNAPSATTADHQPGPDRLPERPTTPTSQRILNEYEHAA
jgi:hypothetical protein